MNDFASWIAGLLGNGPTMAPSMSMTPDQIALLKQQATQGATIAPPPQMQKQDAAAPWNLTVGNSDAMQAPFPTGFDLRAPGAMSPFGSFTPPAAPAPLPGSNNPALRAYDAAPGSTHPALAAFDQKAAVDLTKRDRSVSLSNDSPPAERPRVAGMGYDPAAGGRVGRAPVASNGARLPIPGAGQPLFGGASPAVPGGQRGALATAYAPSSSPTTSPAAPGSQSAGGGFLSGIKDWLGSEKMQDVFLGMAMGSTPAQSMQMAAAQMAEGRKTRAAKLKAEAQTNGTISWLTAKGYDPETARLIAGDKEAMQRALQLHSGGPADPSSFKEVGGQLYDIKSGKWITPPSDGVAATNDLKEYQAAKAQGYGGTFLDYQKELKAAGAPRTDVSVNNGEGAFDKKNAENLANRYDGLVTQADAARQNKSRIAILREQTANLPGGFVGVAQAIASQYGIKLGENASATEAANAIISQMVPAMRIPGSGTTSDRDLELFKAAAPRLSNTPEGNRIIMDTMESLSDWQIQAGDIAAQAQMGRITKEQATAELQRLPDPYARFKQYQQAAKSPQQAKPAGSAPKAGDVMDGYRYVGGDPASPSSWQKVN